MKTIPLPTKCTLHKEECNLVLDVGECSCGAQPYATSRCEWCERTDLRVAAMFRVGGRLTLCDHCLASVVIGDRPYSNEYYVGHDPNYSK